MGLHKEHKELADKIAACRKDVATVKAQLATFQSSASKQFQELHDFMIITQDRTVRNVSGTLNWQKLLEKLFAFLTPIALALLAAIQLLGDK